jgi:uncharacterized protein
MKILIDILHPAHVHFFKNFIWEMKKLGHEIIVTARDKEITLYLLKEYQIEHALISIQKQGKANLLLEFIYRNVKLFSICRKFKPDILLGIMGPSISVVGKILSIPSYIFYDTEHAKITNSFAYKLATRIYTPDCYLDDLGPKQIRYPGYHELAYLHPKRFSPNPEVLKEIGLTEKDTFFVVRFVSWEASHDIGQKGLSIEDKRKLIYILKPHGKIIISAERELPSEFEEYRMSICPTKMHDLLFYADMYIGEGGTMASEAACLGTYSVYINSLPAMGYIKEEIEKYDLIFKSTEWEKIKNKIEYHLSNPNCKKEAIEKTKELINDKVDVTKYLIDYVEDY